MAQVRVICYLVLLASGFLALGWVLEPQPLENRAPESVPMPVARPPVAPPISIEPLRQGSCFEGNLAAGTSARFRVTLAVNEYLHLRIEQYGADVVATVRDPTGALLLRVDGPTGKVGTEHLFLVAALTGDHLLELSAWEDADPDGGFQARVEVLRPATDDDRRRASAAGAFSQARQLEGRKDPNSVTAAASSYLEAAQGWSEIKDFAQQARALYRLAQLLAETSDQDREVEILKRALTLYRTLGDERQQAFVLYRLGLAWSKLEAPERALTAYGESLELWRRLDDPNQEATLLNNLGNLHRQRGEIRRALDHYTQALELWQRLGERRHQATTRSNLGFLYYQLGEPSQALGEYRLAITLLDRQDSRHMAVNLTRMGDALLRLEGPEEALEHYDEALDLRRQDRDRPGEAVTLNGVGLAYQRLGKPRRALESFRTALAIFRQERDAVSTAKVLNNLGSVYERLELYERARDGYEEARRLARDVGHRNAEGAALFGLARFERRLDRLDAARSLIEEAINIVESVRSHADRHDLRSSYLATKQDFYGLLIDVLVEQHFRDPTAGHDASAFEVSERARARSLLDALSEVQSELARAVPDKLLEHRRWLREEVNSRDLKRQRSMRAGADKATLARADEEIRILLGRYREAEARVRHKSPAYATLTGAPTLSLQQVQAGLDEGTLLLEYFLAEERGYVWAVTPSTCVLRLLPGQREIEKAAARTYSSLLESHRQTGESTARLATRELSRLVLGPVADLLDQKRLVIVAPGALQVIPFAALPKPSVEGREGAGEPLVVDHEIHSLPSASVIAILRQQAQGRPPASGLVAVLADPVFERDDERMEVTATSNRAVGSRYFERLRGSGREAETILELAAGTPVLRAVGFDANRELVLSGRLSRYRYVHFATHGLVHTEHPELSAMVLSRFNARGQAQDGYLRAHELFDLDLPVDLVVLSACQSALGKEVRGEGLVGLTRSFMSAGAKQVLVSLWNVNDQATAELMGHFYRGLLRDHLPPGGALQQAQTAMWRDGSWSAPFYWSGFVLQGDWR